MANSRQASTVHPRLITALLVLLTVCGDPSGGPLLFAADPPTDQAWRNDLLVAIVRGDWPRAVALAQNAHAAGSTGLSEDQPADYRQRQAQWTLAAAADQQPGLVAGDAAMPLAWRHPLAQPTNKEAFNLLIEIQTALNARAVGDASQFLAAISDEARSGLLPDAADRQLFVSMLTAMSTAMRALPEWRVEMTRRYGASGQIQVRLAMAERDLAALHAATLQLLGTPAAAEAHQWLGDRQLAIGNFIDAEMQYRAALEFAESTENPQLDSRLRLASALIGNHSSFIDRPHKDWPLGEISLSNDEFTMLLEIVRSHQAAVTFPTAKSILPPAAYRLRAKAPIFAVSEQTAARVSDRFSKQFAVAADERQLYFSNRHHIVAHDRTSGRQNWALNGELDPQIAEEFPGHPFQPLLAGDSLYARRLTRAGIELCCLNRVDGTLRWRQRPRTHVLTDPLITFDEVRALIGGRGDDDLLHVDFARWDRATGQLISTVPLVTFRDAWNQAVPCQWTATERWIACQIGCISAVLTHTGELRWLRRPVWLPPPVDELQADVRAAPPLIDGERLFLAIPGTRAVECVEICTGKLLWRTPEPDLRGFRGLASRRLILDIGAGFHVLDSDSGETVWRRSLDDLLDACLIDEQTILCAQRKLESTSQSRLELVWLSLDTGKELARSPLEMETADRDAWQLGPLFESQEKFYVVGGKGSRRELFEVSRAASQ